MKGKETGDRLGKALYTLYAFMLLFSVAFFLRVIYIQAFWKPNAEIERKLSQPVRKVSLVQKRGSILSSDGRPLAISYPKYQLYIDFVLTKSH